MANSESLRAPDSWRSLRTFGTAAIAVLSLGAGPALTVQAQESAADEAVEEIVVTGSRIRRTEFSSPSPV